MRLTPVLKISLKDNSSTPTPPSPCVCTVCGKSGIRDGPSCKSAEDSQAEAILHESELTLLSEEDLKRCKKETTMFMNEMAQSKRAFAKLASTGFYVTQRGEIVFAEGTSVMTTETDVKRADITHKKCKTTVTTTVPEIRTRMRKAFEERHTEVVINSKITSHVCKPQVEKAATAAPKPQVVEKLPVEQDVTVQKDSFGCKDVDEIVKLIEGTHIKSNDPKKAAKKARQKEKKELERQKQADDKAKEEEMERAEERRRLEEERKKEEDEKRKREDEERRRKEELQRKQKEAADQKKEEQRKKREEIERRKAEEKKQKKDAKKLRREQRKMDVDTKDVTESKTVQVTIEPESRKTELTKPTRGDSDHQPVEVALEKEYGRIKHEKEQRKREEEETRRLEQLQAQERAQANKKNKKKKKKQKHASENQNTDDLSTESGCTDNHGIKVSTAGQPLLELLTNAKCKETQGKGSEEKSNLVTIKKHMDSSVTISMKGKEGESDLVYTLMNGQVYPTSVDGRLRSEEAVPLQHTAFVKHEPPPPPAPVNHTVRVANAEPMSYVNPVKPMGYSGASHMAQDNTSLTEIDLSQLKLPPGITITKVPQHLSGQRSENAIDVPMADPHARLAQSPMTDFHRSRSLSGMENRYNSNVMVVDSRCSSLESPVIGIRPSDMMYSANGTRASSEASIASDRPSSGLDSMCNNNGTSPFITRPGYPSSETLSSRIAMPISSPFATTSRNETPSPAWQHEMNPGMTGLPGMIPNNVVRSDRQGFWSSTPASPVAFPPSNSVHESVIKAQDQQFSWPHIRAQGASYPNVGKRPPTNDGIAPNRKSADFKLAGCGATNVPSYSGAQRVVNGSPDHPAPGTIGYLPGFDSNVSKHVDEWNPWQNNVERQSPELRSARVCASSPYMGYMRSNSRDGDIFGNWAPQPCPEKPVLNRGVNPYGPIGSNISRRPSNSGGNDFSQNGKMTASSGIGDASCWSYNRTF